MQRGSGDKYTGFLLLLRMHVCERASERARASACVVGSGLGGEVKEVTPSETGVCLNQSATACILQSSSVEVWVCMCEASVCVCVCV